MMMKRAALGLVFVCAALAQNPKTAVYPGGAAGDKDLGVQVNNLTTTLTANISSTSATTASVASCTGFLNYTSVTIDSESLLMCSCSAGTMTFGKSACGNADGRGWDGTTAATHSSGATVFAYLIAGQFNQAAKEIQAIETNVPSPVTANHGTSRTVSLQSEFYVCTSTCTVTPLTPSEGTQLCVQNDDNVSTVITLAAISGVQYEATARTSYGTANHTVTSGGAVKDQICIVGRDTTHYNVWSSVGTWTNN